MFLCSSLDKATRRRDRRQRGDVLCIGVTAERRGERSSCREAAARVQEELAAEEGASRSWWCHRDAAAARPHGRHGGGWGCHVILGRFPGMKQRGSRFLSPMLEHCLAVAEDRSCPTQHPDTPTQGSII